MSFFSNEEDEKGHHRVVLGSQWWLFVAVTVPLTVIVFGTWILWQRYRNRTESRRLEVERLTQITVDAPSKPAKETS